MCKETTNIYITYVSVIISFIKISQKPVKKLISQNANTGK